MEAEEQDTAPAQYYSAPRPFSFNAHYAARVNGRDQLISSSPVVGVSNEAIVVHSERARGFTLSSVPDRPTGTPPPPVLPPVEEGWLTKKGKIVTNWKRRWFSLQDGVLSYYKSQKKDELGGKIPVRNTPCGPFSDNVAVTKKNATKEPKRLFVFQIRTPGRVYFIKADSVDDFQKWKNSLVAHGARWLRSLVFTTQVPYSPRFTFHLPPSPQQSPTVVRKTTLDVVSSVKIPGYIQRAVFGLSIKYKNCGGTVRLNGKTVSDQSPSSLCHKVFAHVNEFILSQPMQNDLGMIFKYNPKEAEASKQEEKPKMTIKFLVRDLHDEFFSPDSMSLILPKITFSFDPQAKFGVVQCSKEEDSDDEEEIKETVVGIADGGTLKRKKKVLLKNNKFLREELAQNLKKTKTYLQATFSFIITNSPFPIWSWASSQPIHPSGSGTILPTLIQIYNDIHKMISEKDLVRLKQTFSPLLKDMSLSSLKVFECHNEEEAIEELFTSIFLNYMTPAYTLDNLSKREKDFQMSIAPGGRAVTLVTEKHEWPICFRRAKDKVTKVVGATPPVDDAPVEEEDLNDVPVPFALSCLDGFWRPTVLWTGVFP